MGLKLSDLIKYLLLTTIQDTIGRYYCVGLKRANEIIGTTTEELVIKARQGGGGGSP